MNTITIHDTLEGININIYTNALEVYEGRKLLGRLHTHKPNVVAEIVRLGCAQRHITYTATTFPQKCAIPPAPKGLFKFW